MQSLPRFAEDEHETLARTVPFTTRNMIRLSSDAMEHWTPFGPGRVYSVEE